MVPTLQLLTAGDIQQRLRIRKTNFYENVRPKLPAPIWIGAHPRWREADLNEYIDRLQQGEREGRKQHEQPSFDVFKN